MFGWLKKIFEFDKDMDSISDKKMFEDKSPCKAKVDTGVLVMKDSECSLVSELKQNLQFLNALTKELSDLEKGLTNCDNILNLIKICRNINNHSLLFNRDCFTRYEAEYLIDGLFNNVNIPVLIKELQSIESREKIIQEYRNNISETKKTIEELKGKLGLDDI